MRLVSVQIRPIPPFTNIYDTVIGIPIMQSEISIYGNQLEELNILVNNFILGLAENSHLQVRDECVKAKQEFCNETIFTDIYVVSVITTCVVSECYRT